MNIVMVSIPYPPAVWGGAEVYSHRLARALAGEGNRISVVTDATYAASPDDYVHEGIPVRVLHRLTDARVPLVTRALDYWQLSRKLPPADVYHLQNVGGLFPQIAFSLRRRGQPTVMTVHDVSFAYGNLVEATRERLARGGRDERAFREAVPNGHLARYYLRLALTGFEVIDHLISPSEFMKRMLVEVGVPAGKVSVIRNGMDITRFTPAAGPPTRPVVFFVAASFDVHKGAHLAVEAMPTVLAAVPEARLVMACGETTCRPKIERLIAELGLGARVELLGSVPETRLPELYRQASVTVVPSICPDNSPLVIGESLASGVPLVGSHWGGVPELIRQSDAGVVADPEEPEAFGRAIAGVLTDRPRWHAMSARARAFAEAELAMPAHAARILALYTEVTESAGLGSRRNGRASGAVPDRLRA